MPKKKSIKEAESEEEATTVVTPEMCVDHDEKTFFIDIELPGVDKQHIDLSIGEQSVCVEATRDNTAYLGCFSLAHAVDESKARAKYENGLLQIEVPLKAPIKGKRITIE